MIALIDYGAGNLTSVRKALAALGADVHIPGAPDELAEAAGVIVPGVGNFKATAAITDEWRKAIIGVVGKGRPLLGICLGLQWLFEGSEEAPDLPGLGLLSGCCHLLDAGGDLKVPHVGWNTLDTTRGAGVLQNVPDQSYAYFTHSYVAPITEACVATTMHGQRFAAVVERDHVMGVQFHPEKSGDVGLAILRNFVAVGKERG
jgi:imidazole glycerol-phosphate synthase subunit HisH